MKLTRLGHRFSKAEAPGRRLARLCERASACSLCGVVRWLQQSPQAQGRNSQTPLWWVRPEGSGVLLGRSRGLSPSPPRSRHPVGGLPAAWLARQRSGPGGGRTPDCSKLASRDRAPGPHGPLPAPAGRLGTSPHGANLTSACTSRGAAVRFLGTTTARPALARSGDLAAAPQVMRGR